MRVARSLTKIQTVLLIQAMILAPDLLGDFAKSNALIRSNTSAFVGVRRDPQGRSDKHKIRSLSFCALVNQPSLHDQTIVRTRSVLVTGPEQSFLYSPECNRPDNFVWAEDDQSRKANKTTDAALESYLTRRRTHAGGRAFVVLIGRFIGPGGKRFGHLDQFRMKFLILRVEHVRPVSTNTPWPLSEGISSDVSEAEQTIRQINEEFVFYQAGASGPSGIPWELLADDFSLTDADGNLKGKREFLETKIPIFAGKVSDSDIRVYVRGETAVATGMVVKSGVSSGEERYEYTNEYIRRDGVWQIVSSRINRR